MSYRLLVELLLPNKTDALAYLEGKAPPPPRFAHAILDIRTTKTAYIQDFVVGPLPISPRTTVNPLNYPYNHGGRVKNTMVKGDTSGDWLTQVAVNMSDITMKLWGLKMAGDANDTLAINVYGVGPVEEEGRLIAWNQFSGVTGGAGLDTGTLLPLGL
jgi:primary-amine oxidase